MEKEKLKSFFAEFWKIESSKINDDLKIDNEWVQNFNSLRFYQFIAAIESNFNVEVKTLSEINTFGDLIKNIRDKV